MSAAILQNIYSYLEVLHTAGTEAASEWDEEALTNALKWAEYCEKIYKQSHGKPYCSDLNAAINKFKSLPITVALDSVDLELLKDSKQLLRKALLQNPHVPNKVYEALLHSYGDLTEDPDQLVQDCYSLAQPKALTQVAGFLLPPAASSSPHTVADVAVTVQGQLLLKSMCKLLHMPDQQREKYWQQQLEGLVRKHEGLEVIMTALVYEDENTSSCSSQETKQAIVNWLLHRCPQIELVWSLSPVLLAQNCSLHPSLCQHYLLHLQQEMQHVTEADIPKDITKTVLDSNRYQKLVARFQELLLQDSGTASETTKQFLQSMQDSGQSFIWHEIAKQLGCN